MKLTVEGLRKTSEDLLKGAQNPFHYVFLCHFCKKNFCATEGEIYRNHLTDEGRVHCLDCTPKKE